MPILAPEPMMFPDDLLEVAGADIADSQWWAMYTLPRREKELMRRLRALGISHYCPQISRRNRGSNGRIRVSQVPLFASYVFVRCAEQQRYQTLTTHCVAQCLPVVDQKRLLFDLRQFQRLIETQSPLSPEARILPGRRVRVRSGPMIGLEGTVVKRRGREWLMVSLEFLQRGASVLLEDYQLECI
jgi:transcriptional antiterminator RfaH